MEHSPEFIRTVTAVIASTHPRQQTFHLTREPELNFGGPDKARLFHEVWVPALGRFDTHPIVVLADTIEEIASPTLLRKRLLDELRSSRYQATAEYALRDFGSALTPVLDAAIAAGEVEVVEVRTNTTRFPNTPVRFVKAVGWDRGVPLDPAHAPYALLFGSLVLAYGKTTKTACGKRVATDKLVSREETNCPACITAINADSAQLAEIREAAASLSVK